MNRYKTCNLYARLAVCVAIFNYLNISIKGLPYALSVTRDAASRNVVSNQIITRRAKPDIHH